MLFRASHLLAGSLAVFSAAAASLQLTPDNFDDLIIKSGIPSLVAFTAPWCGHCKNLAPTYEDLAAAFESVKGKVNIAKVDADEHKELGRKFGIQGFPTIKWFDGKTSEPVDYSSGRDLDSLTKFVSENIGVKPKSKPAPSNDLVYLSEDAFRSQVGTKDALVAYTTSWCGHCKALTPTLESLATTFAGEPDVLIAKVDCEAENSKALCQEQGVKSYPTIKFFPNGSKEPIAYEGGRTEQVFIDYLNDKAGTHRVAGGGLNALAGTIAALDTLVAKFTGGETLATVSNEVAKAATGLQDKYADYYVKVFNKLADNAGYVEKESKRLQSLISKGGLAPEKLDDLISRSNILNKFAVKVGAKEEL